MAAAGSYSIEELTELKELAARYCRNAGKEPMMYLYKNKDRTYFDEILKGDRIIHIHPQNNCGDSRNPINGELGGISFTASVDKFKHKCEPIQKSPFGNTRLLVPVEQLADPEKNKLYFADFYCMKIYEYWYKYHNIQLVVTKKDSKADNFCREHLLQLDFDDNPFLSCDKKKKYEVLNIQKEKGTIVEVFYTEELELSDVEEDPEDKFPGKMHIRNDIYLIGKGYAYEDGIPKNPDCESCNLESPMVRAS